MLYHEEGSMTQNTLPRLAEEQQETGLFHFETDYGPGVEKPIVDSLRETDALPLMWLWPGRIPMEKVTFLVGPADSGKSLLAADLAARVSRGDAWPDHPGATQEAGEVVYVCNAHDMTTGVAPRLASAGADPDAVQIFSSTECGYSASALRSARLELGVQIGIEGFHDGSYWCWSLGVTATGAQLQQVRATSENSREIAGV
jgi:hypothetical protein